MITSWIPEEWQEYGNELMAVRHGPENWVRVPDQHKGDAGIEGFSVGGHACQCYAAQGSLTAEELYKKQRAKINTDINKFISNKSKLQRIFGSVVICRWILLVPDHISSDIVSYCDSKRVQVLDARLPYVDEAAFYVKVASDTDYPIARRALAEAGLGNIQLADELPTHEDVESWADHADNSAQIATLERKLNNLAAIRADLPKERLRIDLLISYLHGLRILNGLKNDFPKLYEQTRLRKAARERLISIRSAVSMIDAGQTVSQEMERMEAEFASTAPALQPNHHADLAAHAVADWLLQCPLDFRVEEV